VKYWVGGATGFLGSHVVAALQKDGHDVVAVSRSGGDVSGVRVGALDVLDSGRVAESARGADGAFLTTGKVSRDRADAEELHRQNAIATRNALRGLRDAGVRRVVYASTSGTIAISEEPHASDETNPTPLELIARWPYYRSKYYGELEALEANDPPNFEVVVVNPSLLLGPGDLRRSSTGDIEQFLNGEILAMPRGGLAFVDARDAARAMVSAMDRGRAGERYLVSGANLTVAAFLQRLERLTGVPAPKLPLPRSADVATFATSLFNRAIKAVGGESPVNETSVDLGQHFFYVDCRKAMEELGFEPRDPAETLHDTVSDLVARGVAHPRVGRFARETTEASV
jgi:dihydroflavonol-4-reductase